MANKNFETVRAKAIKVIESTLKNYKEVVKMNDHKKEWGAYYYAYGQITLALESEIISSIEQNNYNNQLDEGRKEYLGGNR